MNADQPEHTDARTTADPATDTADVTVTTESVVVRRSPRYFRFMIIAVIVCVMVAFIVTYSQPQVAGADRNSVFGFMLLVAIVVGIALGSVVAIVIDWIARKRARTVDADRTRAASR